MSDKDKSTEKPKQSNDDWTPVRRETVEKFSHNEEGDNGEA